MPKTTHSRRELLDRLSGIEENDEAAWSDPRKQDRITQLKEEWFLDTFKFLICLPKDTHIWCGSWELMAPLLETFYNYFKDKCNDSPLKILWRRISEEMRQCTQCTCQYHQAQEMYSSEYESSTIGPLLNVLRSLDEERVTQHLKELNARIGRGEYNPELHNAEVVCVMFEVLMFPILLDDQALANEFQIFIEAIDNCHELTLAGHQQYPGVYALFFLKSRRTRSIGHRLAGSIGKLRKAADLEPLQPLLKKCICYLETEVLPPTLETSRPRVQLERISVWLGIKALLGFLEPPAFEEGILERYPIFLSIVLNHVSDDSPEFPHAVNCLRLLFEMLGCKLWLRTTLSPSVMRNTLLGQCFHTRNEKSHKDIFDLFRPFLQSLEALQDGEHEKQRRHFLYFLLHQVKMSSNFSDLMRKKACQIAILIIHRGYKMNPPCPPFECAHMWGPSLICSLKDSSLYDSLRQPAFDLIQTILVSDAAALATLLLKDQLDQCNDSGIFADIYDDGEEVVFCYDEEKDTSCWKEFSSQNKLTSRECRGWMCVPVLWFDVLVESNPSVFPPSTAKAVLWALSRFAMVELDNSMEMTLSVRDLQSTYSGKISFVWETPTGSDDGGDGKDSKNSVKLSSMCIPLIILFKRFTAHFILQMEQGELWMQWKWEPRMAESLILLLLDPYNDVRRVNRLILEYVSKTRGLACGLQFLSSGGSSLSPIYLGLSHAMKLVRLDLVLSKFHNLHHCFFVLYKLLKEALAAPLTPTDQSDSSNISSFSSQGGFLRQPLLDAPALGVVDQPNVVDLKARERDCGLLCEVLWSSLMKCLVEGKTFINNKNSQMTCVRILEILPVVFERLSSAYPKLSGNEVDAFDFKWLDDFMDWGNSSLDVIARYWKQSLNKLLDVLKGLCHHSSARIKVIETLISDKGVAINELKEQISSLSVSLSTEVSCSAGISMLKSKPSTVESFPVEKSFSSLSTNPSTFEDDEVLVLESPEISKCKGMDKIILLSDDEAEEGISSDVNCHLNDNKLDPAAERSILRSDHERKSVISIRTSKNSESFHTSSAAKNVELSSEKHKSDATKKNLAPASVAPTKGVDSVIQEVNNLSGALDALPIQDKGQPFNKITSHKTVCTKNIAQASSMGTSTANIDIEVKDAILKDLIRDDEEDPWERAVKSARRPPSLLTKPGPSVPKRQVVQLNMPGQNKSFNLHRGSVVKRLKRPRLDEWYRPILEMDYFSTVKLSSANEDEKNSSELKKVPVYFQSPDHYEDIFRPLVLEEFKAQLYSSYLETSSEEMCCGSISVLSVERVDDFHLIRCIPGDSDSAASRGCSENDLVLLTRQPLQNSTHDIHVVGKVEKREKDNKRRSIILVIRFYLQNGSSRMNKAKRFLTDRSKWYLSRIMSITPQLREFQALSSLRDIPVLPIILKPTIHSVGDNGLRKVELAQLSQPLQQVLKSSFNESQLLAISAAIGTHGSRKDFELSLVQGPPGTGKTRTILAIVSGLLASGSQQINDTVKQPSNSWGPSNTSSINSRPQLSLSAAMVRAWKDAALARQLNEEMEKNSRSKEYSMRVRVLICAQSNAAVDELVSRISKEGLYGIDGARYKPYLVRVGNPKIVHPSSLPFFIDTLVDQRLAEEKMNGSDGKNDMIGETATSLRSNLEKLVDRIRFFEAKRANIRNGNLDHKCLSEDGASIGEDEPEISDAAVDARLKKLNEQRREICKDLAAAQAREKKNSEESWALRNKLRRTILREAEIVVSTLSGCGGDLYAACSESLSNYKFGISSEHTLFDAVVIDEAAQALEPATLIPLQLLKTNGTKCIMVGDPKQLPATVLSQVASKFLYECSMFERLQRAGHPVVMLTHQYRMHPEICKFPSFHFYNNKLLNGEQMTNKVAPFHDNRNLGPYVFFDVTDGRECGRRNSGALSLYNEHEADAAVEVLRFFQKRYPLEFVGGRIGIISPYKSQVSLLRSRISNTFGSDATADMEFNTVDGFQGREVDILIFSTVRASDQSYSMPGISSSVIGFVADVRRMNVALTRAKLSLWILGNAKTLLTNQNWASLLKNAEERNLIVTMTRPYESVFKKSCSVAKENPDLKQSRGYARGTDDRKRKDIKNVAEKHKRRLDSDGAQNISMNRKCTGEALLQRDIKLLEPEKLSRTGKHGTKGKGQGDEIHCDRTQAKSASIMHAPKWPITHEKSGSETKLPGVQLEADGPERLRALNQGVLRETQESSADDAKQSSSMKEDIHQEREVKGSTVTNSTRPKDLVTARKQQRDAVEALLPSALLSSKKPETTSKSLSFKRPRSPTGKGVIKASKHRKDR